MKVISIQSQVVHGHVGNSAAVFPMQASGLEVAAVPTTLLSNHPHYPTMRGRVLDASLVADLLLGVEERGWVDEASFLVTGYLGSAAIARVVADFVIRARVQNPNLTFVCDPVMGDDDTGIYVADGIREIFADRLVPVADIITPNQFELGLLVDSDISTLNELAAACARLAVKGCVQVVVTGCRLVGQPADEVETIVIDSSGDTRLRSKRLAIRPAGTGDLLTAYIICSLAQGHPLAEAVTRSVDAVGAVLRRTAADGRGEMAIIAPGLLDRS